MGVAGQNKNGVCSQCSGWIKYEWIQKEYDTCEINGHSVLTFITRCRNISNITTVIRIRLVHDDIIQCSQKVIHPSHSGGFSISSITSTQRAFLYWHISLLLIIIIYNKLELIHFTCQWVYWFGKCNIKVTPKEDKCLCSVEIQFYTEK